MQQPDLPGCAVRFKIDEFGDKWISAEDLFETIEMNSLSLEAQGLCAEVWEDEVRVASTIIVRHLEHFKGEIKFLIEDDDEGEEADDVFYGQEAN